MFWSSEYMVMHAIALAASAALLAAALLWPRVGRTLYLALFAWACVTNWRTVLEQPRVYLDYADFALLPYYRAFIEGFFADHITAIVGTIATCQGLIAAGLLVGGRAARGALAGAIGFLVAIAPLGVGSGFPSTLLMAAGCAALLRNGSALAHSLPVALAQGLRQPA